MIEKYKEAKQLYQELLSSKSINKIEKSNLYLDYINKIKKLAYQGFGEAQFDLGLHYEDTNFFGKNDFYNPFKVFYWVKKASDNNVADACNNLGTYYESGIGCKKDMNKAIASYKKAIKLGNKSAVKNLKTLLVIFKP